MKLSESIKPISYLKAHASEMVREVASNEKTYVITQNGEAKAVLQNIKEFEYTQHKLAFLKLAAVGREQIKKGKTKPIDKVFTELDKKIKGLKKKWNTK